MNGPRIVLGLIAIATSVWVVTDSEKRELRNDGFANKTWKLILGCTLLWIVTFPVYLARRRRLPRRTTPRPTPNRVNPVFWWGIGSVAALVLGTFGPWAHVLGASINGTDAGHDGWIVLIVAFMVLMCVLGVHRTAGFSVVQIALGIFLAAFTFSERSDLIMVIHQPGTYPLPASVGWGLHLAIAGSLSTIVQAFAAAVVRERGVVTAAAPPTSTPTRPRSIIPADMQSAPGAGQPAPAER